jgi:hypothetical protein
MISGGYLLIYHLQILEEVHREQSKDRFDINFSMLL